MLPVLRLSVITSLVGVLCLSTASEVRLEFPIPEDYLISGTFGELRGTHFHAGLDIRTQMRTGLKVVAAREGYIHRVVTSYIGYGKCIYIRHPDNTSTVYAHLERFFPELDKRIRERQTSTRQYNQELYFLPTDFPVQGGQLIGYSGNTGSSAGPHLHFEVRDAAENILNPLQWFRQRIVDRQPPILQRIAFEPLGTDSRVQGVFDKCLVYPRFENGQYVSSGVVRVKGRFGLEFVGFDRLEGTTSFNGLYSAELYLDGQKRYSYRMDRFAFTDSRYVYAHIDYAFYAKYNTTLQRAYIADGNRAPIYTDVVGNGVLELPDDQPHTVKLVLKDLHGNATTYVGTVQRDTRPDAVGLNPAAAHVVQRYSVRRNTLMVEVRSPRNEEERTVMFTLRDGQRRPVDVVYSDGSRAFALLPLVGTNLPLRAEHPSWATPLVFGFRQAVQPGSPTTYRDSTGFRAFFPANALFEPLYLEVKRSVTNNPRVCSDVFEVGDPRTPLFQKYTLWLPPNDRHRNFPEAKIVLMEVLDGGRYSYPGRTPNGSGTVKNFGKFCLVADLDAPGIWPTTFTDGRSLAPGADRLVFRVLDELSGVQPYSCSAAVDGQWALLEYSGYQNMATLPLPPGLSRGAHTVVVSAADNVGNVQSKSFRFVVP